MHVWLTEQLGRIPGASTLAKAIRYAMNHWNGLVLFLEDGRLELDTNTVERAIRPVTITRKNALFAGNDSGGRNWACLASLIETALCRARHRQVYAARRTMPNGLVFPRNCRDRDMIGSA